MSERMCDRMLLNNMLCDRMLCHNMLYDRMLCHNMCERMMCVGILSVLIVILLILFMRC